MEINLVKGQKISLKKSDGNQLTQIYMGLGWDPATGYGEIDLDASCIVYDSNKRVIEVIYFGNLRNSDNTIVHSGDNLTGEGDGDDEVIHVDLSRLSSAVDCLVFTINSYSGQTFNDVVNCFARLVDGTTNIEFCKYMLAEQTPSTAMVMAKVYRHNGQWKMSAMGNALNGKTARDLLEPIKSMI